MKVFSWLCHTYRKYTLQKKMVRNGNFSSQQLSEQSTGAYMRYQPPTRWSKQKSKWQYRDHLVCQLTTIHRSNCQMSCFHLISLKRGLFFLLTTSLAPFFFFFLFFLSVKSTLPMSDRTPMGSSSTPEWNIPWVDCAIQCALSPYIHSPPQVYMDHYQTFTI